MSRRSKRRAAELAHARALCAEHFEPLWRPAPWVPLRPGLSEAERSDLRAAAKRAAFVWLCAQMQVAPVESFDAFDLDALRRAYRFIGRATIKTVQRWADQAEHRSAA